LPDEFRCDAAGLSWRSGEADTAIRSAISRVDLCLYDAPREAEPTRYRLCLRSAAGNAAAGNANAKLGQQLLGLELMQVHRAFLLQFRPFIRLIVERPVVPCQFRAAVAFSRLHSHLPAKAASLS
jgi:hypothetical protein